jgi:hypothetical protein
MERKETRMDGFGKHKLAVGTVAALALLGGGGAIAATQLGDSPGEESKAVVNDAAKQLGVQPSALTSALKNALENRIDAAVAAGRLTKSQGEELKQRIESDEFPLFGPLAFGPRLGFAHVGPLFHGLDEAADYLGLTDSELRQQLNSGKTLAEIAKAQDKSVDGLIAALKADAKNKLDAAVKAGRLTKDDEEQILKDLDQRLSDLVNRKLIRPFHDEHFRGFGAPPPFRGGLERPQADFPGV